MRCCLSSRAQTLSSEPRSLRADRPERRPLASAPESAANSRGRSPPARSRPWSCRARKTSFVCFVRMMAGFPFIGSKRRTAVDSARTIDLRDAGGAVTCSVQPEAATSQERSRYVRAPGAVHRTTIEGLLVTRRDGCGVAPFTPSAFVPPDSSVRCAIHGAFTGRVRRSRLRAIRIFRVRRFRDPSSAASLPHFPDWRPRRPKPYSSTRVREALRATPPKDTPPFLRSIDLCGLAAPADRGECSERVVDGPAVAGRPGARGPGPAHPVYPAPKLTS